MSSISGRRRAASTGGMIAFRTAITAAAESAPRNPLTLAPGTIKVATRSADADTSQATTRWNGLSFGRLGRQLGTFWACSLPVITLDGDCFVAPWGGPHPKGVMKVAGRGYSMLEDVR